MQSGVAGFHKKKKGGRWQVFTSASLPVAMGHSALCCKGKGAPFKLLANLYTMSLEVKCVLTHGDPVGL